MQPSEQQIQAFAASWKTAFGEELDPTCARAEALRLLDYFERFAERQDVNGEWNGSSEHTPSMK